MKPTMAKGYICTRCRGGELNLPYIHMENDAEYEAHKPDADPTWGTCRLFASPRRDRILEHALTGELAFPRWNRIKALFPDWGEGWE